MLRPSILRVLALFVFTVAIGAQPDVTSIGPQVGAELPAFSGVDQSGRVQTLQSVMGRAGAMVVFFRSADW